VNDEHGERPPGEPLIPETVGAAAVRDARRWLSRRSVLIAGASGLAVTGLAVGTATGKLPFSQALQRTLGVTSSNPTTQLGSTRVERVYSQARGRMVDLVFILPSKTPPKGLPMSLMLHGLHGNARSAAPTGTLKQLASDVARKAVPAFGFVAVDGGDNYWHEVHPGDDPMAMLLEEVPQWLRARGFGGDTGQPFACTGVSMGGFGALLSGLTWPGRFAAVIGNSPAFWHSYAEAQHVNPGAYGSAAEWNRYGDMLARASSFRGMPASIYIGASDPFEPIVSQLRGRLPDPSVVTIAKGCHDGRFWQTHAPTVIATLSRSLTGAGSLR